MGSSYAALRVTASIMLELAKEHIPYVAETICRSLRGSVLRADCWATGPRPTAANHRPPYDLGKKAQLEGKRLSDTRRGSRGPSGFMDDSSLTEADMTNRWMAGLIVSAACLLGGRTPLLPYRTEPPPVTKGGPFVDRSSEVCSLPGYAG
jgi:hypothetical protein